MTNYLNLIQKFIRVRSENVEEFHFNRRELRADMYVCMCVSNMIDMGTESRMLCLHTPPTQIVSAHCCTAHVCICMCMHVDTLLPLQTRRPNPNSAETVSLPRRPQIHYGRGTSARWTQVASLVGVFSGVLKQKTPLTCLAINCNQLYI